MTTKNSEEDIFHFRFGQNWSKSFLAVQMRKPFAHQQVLVIGPL